jgi:hypothetical protein
LLGLAVLASHGAFGQAVPFDDDRYVTVTEPTELRSAAGSSWYSVARLEPGRVLVADGEDGPWLRVEYPDTAPAAVPVSEGELDAVEGVVTLTRRSRLRAFNYRAPEDRAAALSYKTLFSRDLPDVGSELEYLGDLPGETGETVMWKVVAPEGAQGFILEAATRPATEAEIDAFLASPDDADADADRLNDDAETPEADRSPADAEDQPTGADGPDGRDDPGTVTMGESEANADPDADRDDAAAGEPADSNAGGDERQTDGRRPAAAADDDEGDADEPAPRSTEAIAELQGGERLDAVVDRLRDLDRTFQRILEDAEAGDNAEIEPLIDEYRAIARVGASTVIGDRIQRHAEARIAVLDLRRELRQTAELVEEAERDAATAAERFEHIRVDVEGELAFEYVGRLLPSTVYDGETLPLRYRLVDGDGSRTLAYIAPSSRFERAALDARLGDLVGVAGTLDDTTTGAVPLISPNQLEALDADAEAAAAATTAASPEAEDDVEAEFIDLDEEPETDGD